MARRVWPFIVIGAAALAGCAGQERSERPQRPQWRADAENACLAQNRVFVSQWVQPAPAIEGPGICGLAHPFKVTALAGGTVAFEAEQTLDCSMIANLDGWIAQVVQPAAQSHFGQPVVALRAFGSYSCRNANNDPFAALSEHAFGNAIDISGFRFADGREIRVLRDWNGEPAARGFLRAVHGGGCDLFSTALGPGYPHHDNHFHFDLAMRGGTSRGARPCCKPLPQPVPPPAPKADDLPEPPPLAEDIEVARAGEGSGTTGAPAADAGAAPSAGMADASAQNDVTSSIGGDRRR